jgi:hypothetical protein
MDPKDGLDISEKRKDHVARNPEYVAIFCIRVSSTSVKKQWIPE